MSSTTRLYSSYFSLIQANNAKTIIISILIRICIYSSLTNRHDNILYGYLLDAENKREFSALRFESYYTTVLGGTYSCDLVVSFASAPFSFTTILPPIPKNFRFQKLLINRLDKILHRYLLETENLDESIAVMR